MGNFWDERFSGDEYIYGTEPNEFFKTEIDKLEPGRALFLGEGEGRNSVYAATLGWKVDAVDFSRAGKHKALALAKRKNAEINYTVADLKDFTPPESSYDLVVIIFLHLHEELRKEVHAKAIAALKPGGRIILEVFDKDQLKYRSGGPPNIELLYSLEDVYTDFQDLEIEKFSKEIIELNESRHHSGKACVVRYVGIKPPPRGSG